MKKSLLIVEIRDANGTKDLSKAVQWVDENFDLLSLSSVYEIRNEQSSSRPSKRLKLVQSKSLSVGISIESPLSAEQILEKLTIKQAELNRELAHSSMHLYLLFFESSVSMLPNLHLPHPDWLARKDWILASMDIWPKFEHPVLEEELALIGRNKKIRAGDYFFAQGKVLLKHNMPGT